ncbi:Flagellar motor switch protein FliN [hydrothermal vent metagenome]|uniref:Flagellar motor switch protein FliN n=1 Tax=hydrothermal vent metagenome TaxID=652676 RepID=A0A3B0UTU6_9ZZZZ
MAEDENKDATPEEEGVEEGAAQGSEEGAPDGEAAAQPSETEPSETEPGGTEPSETEPAEAGSAGTEPAEDEEMDEATKAFLEAGKADEAAKAAAAAAAAGEAAPAADEEMDEATKAFLEAGKVDEAAKAAAAAPAEKPEADVQPVAFSNLSGQGVGNIANMDMILDIPVTVSVELGKTRILINELLSLGQGSVVELNKLAGEPMEIMVNGKLLARGEVVVVNEKFGVRLTDIISVTDRISQLG